jgi:DNA polymerase III subunit epsilon
MKNRSRLKQGRDIDEKTPITESKFVAVDFELTGTDENKDSIVAVGAIRMTGGRIELGETFYRFIRPEEFMEDTTALANAQAGLLLDRDIMEPLSEFMLLCGNDVLVGHLISTDLTFLANEVRRLLEMEVKNPAVDTYKLYHWLMRRELSGVVHSSEEVRLYEVAAHLGVAAPGTRNAVNNAFVTAQVFQRLMPLLIKEGVKTIGELLRIGDPDRGANY